MDKKAGKPEGVRAWYDRTTRKYRRIFIVVSVISVIVMTCMWSFASVNFLKRIQEYNGALTIPFAGGLWFFMFIFMFLIPSREASFRGQESLEAVAEKLGPAIEVWTRIGLQVEKEFPVMLQKVNETIDTVKVAVKNLEEGVKGNAELIKEAKPILASLKEIEETIQDELLDDAKLLIDSLKRMSLPIKPAANPASGSAEAGPTRISEPDLSAAISRISKKKTVEPSVAPPKV
jgi:hypothetical protein